ncbi:serine/threonine protein kinase [Penicillium cosmopolitanum]|uniref:non-specific serine/threonine protein kinase n=1 Tax=Penicillium cosmopolitanum TaxID=1131564 RepID=A0A9W9W9C2_9EURO|nr:serine/threonine protein kinase [Penicillium cosmopolitanum]KAJ5408679.1 serine/threonine protein kinase [Penicillium cosmopolitanum]
MLTSKGEEKQAMPRDGFARPFSILGTRQVKGRGFFSNDKTAFKDIPYGIPVWNGFSGWSGEEDVLDPQKRRFEALGEGIHRHSLRDIRQQKRLPSLLRDPINDGRNRIDDGLGPSLISDHVEQYETTWHRALPVPAHHYRTQSIRESPFSAYYHGDTGRGARIMVENSRRHLPERVEQYFYDDDDSTGDKLEDQISDIEQYQSAKASYSTPATSSIPEIVDDDSSSNSSQKSRLNSSYGKETSSKKGEGKNISLMMDGIRLGFKEEAVHGKMINIRSDDAGGFRLSLGENANRKPKGHLPAGSAHSETNTASRQESEDASRNRDERHLEQEQDIVNASGCLLCGVTSMNKGVLTRHLKDQHFPQFEYSCPEEGCPRTQRRKDKIQNHIRTHEGINRESFITKEFPCPAQCAICKLTTNSWDEFYACIIGHHRVGAQQPERGVRRTLDDQRLERGASDSLDRTAPKWPLFERYGELRESIGHGKSSSIRIAYKNDLSESGNEKIYAVKKYRELPQETRKGYEKRLNSKFSIYSALRHPNIVHSLDLLQDSQGVFSMVMEYCAAGDLYTLITNEGKLEPEESDCFFKQLIHGLEYIHEMGVAHRDLKPESLLLTTQGALKIASFDHSECFMLAWEKKAHLSSGLCGSGPYIAPEEYSGKEFYSSVADIWATGLIFMAMRTGQSLWGVSGKDDRFYKQYLEDRKHKRGYSPIERLHQVPCRNVIYAILDPDPSRRITASQILKTEWVHQIKLCAAGEEGL